MKTVIVISDFKINPDKTFLEIKPKIICSVLGSNSDYFYSFKHQSSNVYTGVPFAYEVTKNLIIECAVT